MSIGKLMRAAALCVGIALLTLAPGIGAGAARAGLETWAGALIPSLFPYCFMAIALQQTAGRTIGAHLGWLMRPFGCPAEGVGAFICGWLGGNLAGAKLTAMCAGEGRMSRGQCLRLVWLCTVCSPAFALGVLESAWPRCGWVLLISSWLGTLLGSLILRRAGGDEPVNANHIDQGDALMPAAEAARAMLTVGCYVVLMSVLSAYMYWAALLFMPEIDPIIPAALHAGLEMAGGSLTLCELRETFVLPLICFAITFGGLSISMQVLAFLRPFGISAWAYIGGKALQGVLAALICALFTRGEAVTASAINPYSSRGFDIMSALPAIIAVILGAIALLLNKRYIEYENADDAERARANAH